MQERRVERRYAIHPIQLQTRPILLLPDCPRGRRAPAAHPASNSDGASAQDVPFTSTPTSTSTPRGYISPTPTSPPRSITFSAISAGHYQTCGLRPNGEAVCWGWNSFGERTPPTNETFKSISAGGQHVCALRTNGTAVCWGRNNYGQSTPLGGVFTSIDSGSDHTCGLRANGTVECWGRDENGQLGRNRRPPVDHTFKSISAGTFITCGIVLTGVLPGSGDTSSEDRVACWGRTHFPNRLRYPSQTGGLQIRKRRRFSYLRAARQWRCPMLGA